VLLVEHQACGGLLTFPVFVSGIRSS